MKCLMICILWYTYDFYDIRPLLSLKENVFFHFLVTNLILRDGGKSFLLHINAVFYHFLKWVDLVGHVNPETLFYKDVFT